MNLTVLAIAGAVVAGGIGLGILFRDEIPGYRHEVAQISKGVASDKDYFWVTDDKKITRYDKSWNVVSSHSISGGGVVPSDMDVGGGNIYVADKDTEEPHVNVYDGDTVELKRKILIDRSSGQEDCSGVAIDEAAGLIWLASASSGESGKYLYAYGADDDAYRGKVRLEPAPSNIVGLACNGGRIYMSADDGADGAPDNIYSANPVLGEESAAVTHELKTDGVQKIGELGGITFDNEKVVFLNNDTTGGIGAVYIYDIKK